MAPVNNTQRARVAYPTVNPATQSKIEPGSTSLLLKMGVFQMRPRETGPCSWLALTKRIRGAYVLR
jgi:hypothetical protein